MASNTYSTESKYKKQLWVDVTIKKLLTCTLIKYQVANSKQ